jgi:hypothetical protein
MIVDIGTILECSIDEAIVHAKSPRLLEFVAAPLVRFVPVSPLVFPEAWSAGKYLVSLRLLGVVPFGKQEIVISMPPSETGFSLRDAGYSAIVNTWDHLIRITPHGSGCYYRDRVEVRAGLLTPIIWLFAQLFYRHRQRRWRALVKKDFDYGSSV